MTATSIDQPTQAGVSDPEPVRSGSEAPGSWEPQPRWPSRGRLVRRLARPAFVLKEKLYPPGARIPPHDHPYTKACLTLSGGCLETRDGRRRPYDAGMLQLNPVGSEHTYRCGDFGMRVFSVTLGPEWDPALASVDSETIVASRDAYRVALARRLYRELLWAVDGSGAVVEELIFGLIDPRAGRREDGERPGVRRTPAWLERLLELLHDEFREPLGLGRIAAEVGIDRSHAARVFRSHFGCTIGEYVRSLRVSHARMLLLESDAPIADVAAAAGFSDQSHMGRTFRQLMHRTPVQVRNGEEA